ncbi:Uncharacterised protein [Achromobacter xylosoxidans]|nr:Uncharacterised protein [Achromobacter xylosoxidans]
MIGADRTADHAVGIAQVHHHRADQGHAAAHFHARHFLGDATSAHALPVRGPVLMEAFVVFRVGDFDVLAQAQAQAEFLDAGQQHRGTAHQDGTGQAFVHHYLHRAQHALVLAFGEHDAGRAAFAHDALGRREQRLHEGAGVVHELLQLLFVGFQVWQRTRGHAAFHGGLGHRRRDAHDQARIERLGNQVLGAERDIEGAVGGGHHLVLLLLGQLGDGIDRRLFHFTRDRRGAHIQRAAEDVREAQHVVDLVRVVRTARCHDDVVTHAVRHFRQDFRRRVGQRQNQRTRAHLGHHLGLEHAAGRQAQEHVRALDHLGQLAGVGLLGEARLVRVHQHGAAFVDHAFDVGDPDVFQRQPQVHHQVQAGQRGRAGARRHHLDLVDVLAHDLQAVDEGGGNGDGGAMLVVMEDGDLHALAQLALDGEAFRRLDVFQVDAAEGGFQAGDDLDQLVRVGLVDLDVEHVQPGEFLEQHRLAFHHRLGGQGTDIAQAQHRGAVGDHAHQVAAAGVAEHIGRVRHDFLAGRRHPGRVRQGQVTLVDERLGGHDGDLSRGGKLVVIQSGLAVGLRIHGAAPPSLEQGKF